MLEKSSFFLLTFLVSFANAKLNSSSNRALISGHVFNFQFSDPVERVICTRGLFVDPKFNDAMCKKEVFDSLAQLNFYIIGDMGGSSVWLPTNPYTTHAQRSVASAMAQQALKEPAQFVVNLGDNFYLNGVMNVNDERFQHTFENAYEEKTLGVPWFSIPGNHDYHGNIQAQIDYTNRSTRWTWPAKNADEPWYKFRYSFGTQANGKYTTLDFFMLDTVMLCGMTEDVRGDSYLHWIFHESNKNPTKPIPGKEAFAKRQLEWLATELQLSKADYVFVAGHYPVYSVGKHGFFYNCLKDLEGLLRKSGVTAYLSGHDHNMQHLRVDSPGTGTSMNYIVSGAGASTDRSQEHWDEFKAIKGAKVLLHYSSNYWWLKTDEWFSWSTGGFIQAQVGADKLTLNFYSGQGSACFKIPILGWYLPGSINCQTLVHQTILCPRINPSADCVSAKQKEQEQNKKGWGL